MQCQQAALLLQLTRGLFDDVCLLTVYAIHVRYCSMTWTQPFLHSYLYHAVHHSM